MHHGPGTSNGQTTTAEIINAINSSITVSEVVTATIGSAPGVFDTNTDQGFDVSSRKASRTLSGFSDGASMTFTSKVAGAEGDNNCIVFFISAESTTTAWWSVNGDLSIELGNNGGLKTDISTEELNAAIVNATAANPSNASMDVSYTGIGYISLVDLLLGGDYGLSEYFLSGGVDRKHGVNMCLTGGMPPETGDLTGELKVTGELTTPSIEVEKLTIGAGAKVTLSSGSTNGDFAVVVKNLDIQGTGSSCGALDLNNNSMIVTDSDYATVAGYVAQGFNSTNGGYWNGKGITSSTAQNEAGGYTGLAVVAASDYMTQTGNNSFKGYTLSGNEILVVYAYYGDCNLDGAVNDDDYQYINYAYNVNDSSHLGWLWGDFNYDGVINDDDYGYINYLYMCNPTSL